MGLIDSHDLCLIQQCIQNMKKQCMYRVTYTKQQGIPNMGQLSNTSPHALNFTTDDGQFTTLPNGY